MREQLSQVVFPSLPSMRHYLNLTNGLEASAFLEQQRLPYGFVRIQSTACEQQHFDQILRDVDSDLLMHLALGRVCCIWDYGSRNKKRGVPRAFWYGLEWIRWYLEREWLGRDSEAFLRGFRVTDTFLEHAKNMPKPIKKRIRYFKQYTAPDLKRVGILGMYRATDHDDDPAFYRNVAASCAAAGASVDDDLVSRVQMAQDKLLLYPFQPDQQPTGAAISGGVIDHGIPRLVVMTPTSLSPGTVTGLNLKEHMERCGWKLFLRGINHSIYHAKSLELDVVNR